MSLILVLGLTAALVPALAFGLVLALADSGNSTDFYISSDSVPSSGSDSVSGNKIALRLRTRLRADPVRPVLALSLALDVLLLCSGFGSNRFALTRDCSANSSS